MKSFEVISELISGQALDLIACKKSMSIRRLFTRDFNFIRIYDYVHIENIKQSCNVLCDGRDYKFYCFITLDRSSSSLDVDIMDDYPQRYRGRGARDIECTLIV